MSIFHANIMLLTTGYGLENDSMSMKLNIISLYNMLTRRPFSSGKTTDLLTH